MPRSIPMRWVSAAVMTTAAASAAIATPSAPFSTGALCPDTTGVWHPDTLTIEITLPDRKCHDLMVSKMDLHALDVLPFVVLANMTGFEINVVRIVDDEVSWQESWLATQQWQGLGTVLGDDTLSQRKIWVTIHIDPNVTPSQAALGCLCPYDINANGSMSAADLAAYMDLYNGDDPTADVKPDACLNNCDLQAIVDAIGP